MEIPAERKQELAAQMDRAREAMAENTGREKLRFAFDPSAELAARLRTLLRSEESDAVPLTLYSAYTTEVTRYERNRYEPADVIKMRALKQPIEHGGKANRPLGRYARVRHSAAEFALELSVLMNSEMVDDLRASKLLDRNAMRVYWAVETSALNTDTVADRQTQRRIGRLSIALRDVEQLIYGDDSENRYMPSPEIGASVSNMRLALRRVRTQNGLTGDDDLMIG